MRQRQILLETRCSVEVLRNKWLRWPESPHAEQSQYEVESKTNSTI